MSGGVQVYALWARSVCDGIGVLKRSGRRYEEIAVYGLSRGSRTVKYIRGLCPEVDFAFW